MESSSITLSDFDSSYKKYVLEWIQIMNNTWSNFYVIPDDFYSLVIEKLFINKKIENFNSNHQSNAKFKTWLNIFLKHLHTDLYRKKSHDSLDKLLEDNNEYVIGLKQDSFSNPTDIIENDVDAVVRKILERIETISKLRDRILVKLKLYIPQKIHFSNTELDYLMHNSGNSSEELIDVINGSVKDDGFGIRDEDIAMLTDFAKGSVNTTYQRIVRKLNLKSYKL